jgi:hypothetical protein
MEKAYLGVDPGKGGAAALIVDVDEYYVTDFVDFSTTSGRIRAWNDQFRIKVAAIEKVHARPKQGVVSSFNFGANFGFWQGTFAALKIPYILTTPQNWQKSLLFKADGKDTKERSLVAARRLFPGKGLFDRKMDHGRADAILIAWNIMGNLNRRL